MTSDLRDSFFDELLHLAKNDKNIIFIAADQGAFSLEKFRRELPDQYINIGISEQALINVAAGLALMGKKVFVYAIAPFITARCYEQIKVDICVMNLPITIIGAGPGFCYSADGPTHHACEDIGIMSTLPNMSIYTPADYEIAKFIANETYKLSTPSYVRLDKGSRESLYDKTDNLKLGYHELIKGNEHVIISLGYHLKVSKDVIDYFNSKKIQIGLIDLFKINKNSLTELITKLREYKYIFTIEDTFISSGIGSLVSNTLINNEIFEKKIYKFGPQDFVSKYGDRDWIDREVGIDFSTLKSKIENIIA